MSNAPEVSELSRRSFVVTTTIAGAGLLLGVRVPGRRRPMSETEDHSPSAIPFAPNAWIRLDETGDVTILVHKSEMGQGVWTALPMIVAEEMDADWRRVRAERAPTRPEFDTATGGSSSVSGSWDALRKAGAAARSMLVTAAAQRWSVSPTECTTSAGEVVHTPTRRRLTYGALARDAATVSPPDEKSLILKDPRTFRLLGRDTPRLDTPAKVTGKATFGIDVKVPGMLVAVVARCPTFAGKVARVDDSKALAVPGVRHVVPLDPVPRQLPGRVAVLADSTWAAMQGKRALDIQWDLGDQAGFSTDAMWQEARRLVDDGAEAKINRAQGDTAVKRDQGQRIVEATLIDENSRAVVAGDDTLRRVQARHPVETTQGSLIITIETAQGAGDEMHADIVGHLAAQAREKFARLSFLAAREMDEDHVHPRFKVLRVERQRLLE